MPFRKYKLKDGTILQLFQGNRGVRPDLDFKVKQIELGKSPRTPSHTHWIVDMIMKIEIDKKGVSEFSDFLMKIYINSTPFNSILERNNYKLKYVNTARKKFGKIKGGKYSVEYITAIVELFSKCEKQYPGAYMFEKSLKLIQRYSNDQCDYFTLVGHSKRV